MSRVADLSPTSAGSIISARQQTETHLLSILAREARSFLSWSAARAIESFDAGPLVASSGSGESRRRQATLADLRSDWESRVPRLTRRASAAMGLLEGDPVLDELRKVLLTLELPNEVYGTISTLLEQAKLGQWSRGLIIRRVNDALDYANGSAVVVSAEGALGVISQGLKWRSRITGLARWLSTALTTLIVLDRARQEIEEGEKITAKRWVSVGDNRVRPTHQQAHGQTVPLDEPFIVGGFPMIGPGDPSAPYHETARCRCVPMAVRQTPNPAPPPRVVVSSGRRVALPATLAP